MPALPVLLTIVFVILKLCSVIMWSWLWVLSPLWISALLVVIFLVLMGLGFVTWSRKVDKEFDKRSKRMLYFR